MQIHCVESADIYQKIASAPPEKKADLFRYELMMPFKGKWDCYSIPIKAEQSGGYDVVMACGMLGILTPDQISEKNVESITLLQDSMFRETCYNAVQRSLTAFAEAGIELKVTDYTYSILLADPQSPYITLCDGYSGDGGIPGYILAFLVPKAETMQRIPSALAHECNHNIRFQHIKWRNDITLGEMMVSEGLAEVFAEHLFGSENIGPWVSKTDHDTLENYIKPLIKDALDVSGLENLTAWLYGDELAHLQGYFPVGMPYCAGYACGYHMIKYYLQKTGDTIFKATIRPASQILRQIQDFWE